MSLIDPSYFAFLIFTATIFHIFKNEKLKVLTILLASLFFYSSYQSASTAVLLLLLLMTFLGTIGIDALKYQRLKNNCFVLLIFLILTPMFFIKYFYHAS